MPPNNPHFRSDAKSCVALSGCEVQQHSPHFFRSRKADCASWLRLPRPIIPHLCIGSAPSPRWRRLLSERTHAPVRRKFHCAAGMRLDDALFIQFCLRPDFAKLCASLRLHFIFSDRRQRSELRCAVITAWFFGCGGSVPSGDLPGTAADCELELSGHDTRISQPVGLRAPSQTPAAKACLTLPFAGRFTPLRFAAASEPLRCQSAPLRCAPRPANG